jgi:GNAT superfamily N-acetyltransferase
VQRPTVRAAVAADLPALRALYRQLYPELDPPDGAAVDGAWAATLATPGRTVLVGVIHDRVVGTADLTVLANAARDGRPYLLVENVVVGEAHRRSGIGRALLDAARDHGEAAGCYKLQLSADEPAAFAFYEAAGLRPAARTYKQYL